MKAMMLERRAPIEDAPLTACGLPDPVPGEGEIRIRVRCCALCRTDLHVIEADLPQAKLPVIPGHQVVGVVDEVGPNCRQFVGGERVGIAWLRHTCGACDYCRGDRENLCENQRFTGYHADGGYAELAVVPEAFAYALPAEIDDVHVAPLLCAGIIGYRALLRSRLEAGQRLALFGFGSSAHLVMQIALAWGCEVYVVSRGASHRALAVRMGASWTGERAEGMPAKVDSAIIFAPAGGLVPPALEQLRPGGTLALAGIHMSAIPAMDYDTHLFYERDVRSVTANTRADGRALLVEASRLRIRPTITTYALDDANRALQDLKSDRINGTGVLCVGN